MVQLTSSGNFEKATTYLQKLKQKARLEKLEQYGREGIRALASATPVESGKTAGSWYFEIHQSATGASIEFFNSNKNKGVPIAIILQYGHGTGTGGYVQGRDYINPAIQPIFDKIAEDVWREVTSI